MVAIQIIVLGTKILANSCELKVGNIRVAKEALIISSFSGPLGSQATFGKIEGERELAEAFISSFLILLYAQKASRIVPP